MAVESKHVTNCQNVETYLDRLIAGVKTGINDIAQGILVDLIGKLDKISKKAKIFVDEHKKGLPLEVGQELYGEITKIRKTAVEQYGFNTEEVYDHFMNEPTLELRDFCRAAKIEAKALATFLDKKEIAKLRHFVGTTERYYVEDIKK
jgi:hypothetical protein